MYLGIDLGGTKTEAVVLGDPDPVTGRYPVLFRKRLPTPQGDYPATLETLAVLVSQAEQQVGPLSAVGLGTPGALSADNGLMKNCNSTCLNGQALQQDLQKRVQKPVMLANDANCFALSEAIDGAGRGAEVVFGVILGTGVGGGIVVREQLLQGVNRISGEWGHNPLPAEVLPEGEARRCYCGRTNCVETFLCGPGLSLSWQQATAGDVMTAQQVVQRAEQGDALAEQVLQRYCEQLAAALAQVINVLDPDCIVLGGGMGQTAALYERVPQLWSRYVFSDWVHTRLCPPVFGDASGVRGAAWLTR